MYGSSPPITPVVELKDNAGKLRVIAGSFGGQTGPANTFTPINVFDLDLEAGARPQIEAPDGHTTLVVVLSGALAFEGKADVRDAEAALFSRHGEGIMLSPKEPTKVLMLT